MVPQKIIDIVARDEHVSSDYIKRGISSGRIIIFYNPIHKKCRPLGIGQGLRTKINANIGTSVDYPGIKTELKKLKICVEAKADAVMDLSTGGNIDKVRRSIISKAPMPIGTVPVYQAVIECGDVCKLSADKLFEVIERHCADGVDFVTVHCGVTKRVVNNLKKHRRVMDIVSRGGAMHACAILKTNKENPLFEQYDRLLEIAKKYNVVLSLGDGMRPGCIADATDISQISELKVLSGLAKRALKAGVQSIIEGPGHVPLNQIEENIKLQKKICNGAPFYVLGPLPTDIAPGYDHLTSAIGGALAGYFGADFLCYVTPAEHLGLPNLEEVREGIMASRIAAHIADIAKGIPGAGSWDLDMAKARKQLNWKKQKELSIDPQKFNKLKKSKVEHDDVCSMCGEFCSMKMMNEMW